ncbi:Zn-dependent exopeptidase M28 [Clostridium botulinum]|nr:Zn-dependent exopeptidase M28 [Clostridium botulinum]NFG24660.1 Zn-dependent exopeptidase M28 [Clostridium botulinum]NFL58956.1 Zn-dependent exopeptidase M28 [Clostridium botulinum]NFL62323.1 Zn-dependent exopeptidase M28 [Clostridium botulinum]NFO67758.1 Zn-dependent exopeptidase M28 [Clostridium botulinum]
MKKIIYYGSLLLIFLSLVFSIFLQTTYYHFNSSNVKNNIEIISSDVYEGRLTGSIGNEKTANFIETWFKDVNLIPLTEDYKESFYVNTPFENGNKPSFKILNNDKVLYDYKYGIDYKEDLLNFNESSVTFNKEDILNIFPTSLTIKHNEKIYLFYTPSCNNFSFRSSFNDKSDYQFSIAITTELYNNILDSLRTNNLIKITLPYSKHEKSTSNVIGKIKGTSKDLPPLVITAHFDHVGQDYLNNCYGGALDNASGTAFLMELSKNLSSFIKPKRDIIFVALTGEEFGLLGSSNFVQIHENLIKNSKIINFDMIGAANTPISIMSGSVCKSNKDANINLLNSLEIICSNKNINYKIAFEDCSDHASFTNMGMDAVTLCHSDVSKIHTPNDKVEYIDTKAIDDVYSLVKDEISNYAYDDFRLVFYNNNFILFLFALFLFIFFFPTIKKKFKHYVNKNKIRVL